MFLGGCDFRCPFCHNAELLDAGAPAVMEDAELLAFLEKRRGLLDGVAITGGEPLLRSGLYELLSAIRALGYPVKLDTNGNHPAKLKELVAAGLVDYVAMDVKNSPARSKEAQDEVRQPADVGETVVRRSKTVFFIAFEYQHFTDAPWRRFREQARRVFSRVLSVFGFLLVL